MPNPPKVAVRIANIVFGLGILFSILVIVYALYRIFFPIFDNNLGDNDIQRYYLATILFGGICATFFVFGLRLSDNLKVNLSMLLVATGISVYGVESYLEVSGEKPSVRAMTAKKMEIPYDTRTTIEVLEDLNDAGIKAYPNVRSRLHIASNGLNTVDGGIYSFGGISNHTTVFCNENGYWAIYESDEHGFNNPKGSYEVGKVDIVLAGDSFTEGACVKPSNNIGAMLRKLDFSVTSLGKSGNGPLIEFATLKEYARALKPKIVLWLYFVNDLEDLQKEMSSSLLQKYLNDDNFSQNLITRQNEIDSLLVNYVQGDLEREERANNRIIRIFKLLNLRSRLNLRPTMLRDDPPTPTPSTFPIFKEILQKSKQMVSGWGGELYFVYLPPTDRYLTGKEDKKRSFVMVAATELGIPIIDIHTEVFLNHPDPLSLLPLRLPQHYNAEGYRLVAEAIAKRLRADKLF